MAKKYGADGTAGISTQTGGKHKFGVVRSDNPRGGTDPVRRLMDEGVPPHGGSVYNADLGKNVNVNATDPETDARSAPSDWASPGVNREPISLASSESGTGNG